MASIPKKLPFRCDDNETIRKMWIYIFIDNDPAYDAKKKVFGILTGC